MKIFNSKIINQAYKLKKLNKKIYFLLILFVCLICINVTIVVVPIFLFHFFINNDLDTCLDIGYCKKGLEINTQYGKVKISKQNCLKYNWEWHEKDSSCRL